MNTKIESKNKKGKKKNAVEKEIEKDFDAVKKEVEKDFEVVKKEVEREFDIVKKGVEKEVTKYPKRSTLSIILLFTLLVAFVEALKLHNWVSMLMIFIISILIFLPLAIAKFWKIDIPIGLEVFFVLFIYATLFLGELKNYYAKYLWWDTLLHTSSGLAFGIIGFIILYLLYKTEKIKASPKMVAMFTFTFALAIGALWEIVEFTIDSTFGPISNGVLMQTVVNGCGLADTMKDLIVDSIGGLFSSVMGYLYLKKDSGIVIKPVAKEFKKDNPKLFKTK